jgi:hypothetical protein
MRTAISIGRAALLLNSTVAVCYDNDGLTAIREPAQNLHELALGIRIKVAGRFVE